MARCGTSLLPVVDRQIRSSRAVASPPALAWGAAPRCDGGASGPTRPARRAPSRRRGRRTSATLRAGRTRRSRSRRARGRARRGRVRTSQEMTCRRSDPRRHACTSALDARPAQRGAVRPTQGSDGVSGTGSRRLGTHGVAPSHAARWAPPVAQQGAGTGLRCRGQSDRLFAVRAARVSASARCARAPSRACRSPTQSAAGRSVAGRLARVPAWWPRAGRWRRCRAPIR